MDCKKIGNDITCKLRKYPLHILYANPIYLSIVITCIIMLIIGFTYNCDNKIKTGFWIFATIITGVFLNNQSIIKTNRDMLLTETERNLIPFISSSAGLTPSNITQPLSNESRLVVDLDD